MSCAGCFLSFDGEETITCTIEDCEKIYHADCTNKGRLTKEEIQLWACPDCTVAAKSIGKNADHTPVRAALDNITHRRKAPLQPRSGSGTGAPEDADVSVSVALKRLSAEISLWRQSTDNMLMTINKRLDGLCEQISGYDTKLKKLEKLESENTILKATVSDLRLQLDSQAQASLRNEIEVYGLDETPEENPYHLVFTTAVKLGIDLQDTDLAHVSRVGPKRQVNLEHNSKLPRPVAVAFVRRAKRDEFLKQAKVRRNIKSGDIVERGSNTKVYINERLTSGNRHLFRNARVFAKEHGYKHCWVRNGKIFVRRQDASRGSPAIHIRSEDDLSALLPAAVPSEDNSIRPDSIVPQ